MSNNTKDTLEANSSKEFEQNNQSAFIDTTASENEIVHVSFSSKSVSKTSDTDINDDESATSKSTTRLVRKPTGYVSTTIQNSKSRHESNNIASGDDIDRYGPTYKDEDNELKRLSSEGTLLARDVVATKNDYEEINMSKTYTYNSSTTAKVTTTSTFSSSTKGKTGGIFSFFSRKQSEHNEVSLNEEEKATHYDIKSEVPYEYQAIENRSDSTQAFSIKQRNVVFRQLFGGARYPIITWLFAIIMVSAFIFELVRNSQLTGNVIQTSPFNPMVGPNYVALVGMGSKFAPCMTTVSKYPPSFELSNCYSINEKCTIETACGLGGFGAGGEPNQTYRFFTAIFVHAGLVHLILNLLSHLQLGVDIERKLGSVRFFIIYIGSGVWGFILSGTLSGTLSFSMGCSGSLFGLLGYEMVELFLKWKEFKRPKSRLLKIILFNLIVLAIGLLPGFDNISHLGGFLMGILLSTVVSSTTPFPSKTRIFCVGAAKLIAFILVVLLYVLFLHIFFTSEDLDSVCPNCKYLSCLPVNGWCDI